MSLSTLAAIADLVTAIGVIGSLLFLGYEVRKNSLQSQVSNQQNVIAGLREARDWSKDLKIADVIVRGRKDFQALSETEQEVFNSWSMNNCNALFMTIMHGNAGVMLHRGADAAFGNLVEHFRNPGVRDWYEQSGLAKRWPEDMVKAIDKAIKSATTTTAGS